MTLRSPSFNPTYGELEAEYKQSLIGFSIFSLLFFAGALWMLWAVGTTPPVNRMFAAIIGLFALGWLGFSLWHLATYPWRIELYEHGMLARRLVEPLWLPWDGFAELHVKGEAYQGIASIHITLQMQDGRRLRFGNLPNTPRQPRNSQVPRLGILELGLGMLEITAAARFRHLQTQFDAGRPLVLHKLQIAQQGITWKRRTLSGAQISDLQTDDDLLIIKAHGQTQPWASILLNSRPNQDLIGLLFAHAYGRSLTIVEAPETTPELTAAWRKLRRSNRIRNWLIVPLLFIGINGVWIYGQYYFSARGYFDRGQAALARGELDQAISDFSEVIAQQPEFVRSYTFRGYVYHLRGENDAALADYAQALQLQPNSPWLHTQHGALLFQLERYEAALEAHRKALALRPNDAIAYCGSGDAHWQLQQIKQARTAYRACLQYATDPELRAAAEAALSTLQ
jgi:lipoprotein NlpI